MDLTTALQTKRNASARNIPKEKYEVMQTSTRQLQEVKLAEGALKTGQKLPEFELPNVHGKNIKSADLLQEGTLVISFYRGGWCPYCNMELKAIQSILDQIREAGAQVIAITPETPDNSLTTSEKNELEFEVLSDIDNKYAKELGLVFQLPEELVAIYDSFNIDLVKHNENEDHELPMPATYIVNTDGEVIYDFVMEDYTYRLDPEEILSVLKKTALVS
ncbi:MAG: peroxiredoxin-like family protein [Bacteroidota bacterium]